MVNMICPMEVHILIMRQSVGTMIRMCPPDCPHSGQSLAWRLVVQNMSSRYPIF